MKSRAGSRLLGGAQKAALMRAGNLYGPISVDNTGYTRIETIGLVELDGRPAYDVKLTTKEKTVEHMYFDQESGLVLRIDQKVPTAVGIFRAQIYPSDFREVDGVMFPFRMLSKLGKGAAQEVVVQKIEVNPELPADAFAPPDDIQALVEAH